MGDLINPTLGMDDAKTVLLIPVGLPCLKRGLQQKSVYLGPTECLGVYSILVSYGRVNIEYVQYIKKIKMCGEKL